MLELKLCALTLNVSTFSPLAFNWNRPKRSGDKGPLKNYNNKLKKKLKKFGSQSDKAIYQ